MPKIPTFISEARPTAEVKSVKTNIQVPLSQTLAGALSPLTDLVVKKAVQENNTQNRTEALTLGNEFVVELHKLNEEIYTSEEFGANKTLGLARHKEQSNNLINKYKNRATNSAVSTMFTNNALSSVQKSFFRIDRQIQKNIITKQDIAFNENQKDLITTALFNENGKFDALVLTSDLEKLTIDTYTGTKSFAEIQEIITAIPGTIQTFQASKDIANNPRFALRELNKGTKSKIYPDIPVKERTQLVKNARSTLAPQIKLQWENYEAKINAGKKPAPFDYPLAKDILGNDPIVNKMIARETQLKDMYIDVAIINSTPMKNLDVVFKEITEDYFKKYGEVDGAAKKKYLDNIRTNRLTEQDKDPVKLMITTDKDIEASYKELSEETNPEMLSTKQIQFANDVIKKQRERGITESKQRVMTNNVRDQFIAKYKESSDAGDAQSAQLLMESLKFQYGDLESKALSELMLGGLPPGVKAALQFGKTSKVYERFFGLDSPEKIASIEKFLKDKDDTDISLDKIRTEIINKGDFNDIYNIVRRNVPFNISDTSIPMDEVLDTFSLYAASLMFSNPGMSVKTASEEAAAIFSNNFRIEDTYYIPNKIGDLELSDKRIDFKVKELQIIKDNYINDTIGNFNPVAFKSHNEKVAPEELTERMKYNIKENGEWRNTADGEAAVFGIVFKDASFGILLNKDGQELRSNFDDDTFIVEGIANKIDMTLPSEYEKSQYRGYYGYGEKIKEEPTTFGKRFNPTNELIEQLNTTSIGDVVSDLSIFTKLDAAMPALGDKFLADSSNIKMLTDDEGFRIKPYFLEYKDLNGKMVNETFRTVGKGHKITEAEEKSGKIHGFNIDTLTKAELEIIFKKDLKEVIKNVDNLVTNKNINPTAYSILVQMGFQLGGAGLSKFDKTIKAINKTEYKLASEHMLKNYEGEDYKNISKEIGKTKWHIQTEKRAKKLAKLMASLK